MRSGYLCCAYENTDIKKKLQKGYELLNKLVFSDYSNGRYEIDNDIFFIVQRYKSRPECEAKYEAHRKYADIQYIISGSETIDCACTKKMKLLSEFDEQKDIGFYKDTEYDARLKLSAGQYCIFMPEDGHKSSFYEEGEEACMVEKIVVKVRI